MGERKLSSLDDDMEGIFHPERDHAAIPEAGQGREDMERQGYYRSASVDMGRHPLEDQDRHDREENTRRESIHDTLATGHSAPDFAHAHHPLKKIIKSSGHSVKKKSRQTSEKAEPLEEITEDKVMSDPSTLEKEVDSEEDSNPEDERTANERKGTLASLPWRQASEEPALSSMPGTDMSSFEPVRDLGHSEAYIGPGDTEDLPRKGSVLFQIGDEEADEEPTEHRKKHKKSGHHREPFSDRYRQGSELHEKLPRRPVTPEEDVTELDRDDIGARRFDKPKSIHKIDKAKERKHQDGALALPGFGQQAPKYGHQDTVDHTPHELFVEMDELEGEAWVERARWIKYEEDLEADRGQWGKPHVASLSFHSLVSLRRCLEGGALLLDITVRDLPELLHRVVEDLSEKSIIEESMKEKVLGVLLYRHKHVHPHSQTFKFGLKRSMSQRSIQGLIEERRSSMATMSQEKDKDKDHLVLDMNGHDNLKRSSTQGSFKGLKRNDSIDDMVKARKQNILACMEKGTEGCIVLVGTLDDIRVPIVAFVRLAEAVILPNTIEVGLPIRFVFILLTPTEDMDLDAHEIGRAMSTLMSNPAFHNVCYRVEEKRELLHGINEFLDDSVVLPPGDWDKKNLLSMGEMMDMRKRMNQRKQTKQMQEEGQDGSNLPSFTGAVAAAGGSGGDGDGDGGDGKKPDKGPRNPLKRSTMMFGSKKITVPFGGLIDDIKHRYVSYKSDILDGLNSQCIAAAIFIYFAALSGAIAFGGLMGAKTDNNIGISETLIVSSVAGIAFSLLAGCPLIIIGVTGPVLLYDEALYGFSTTLLPDKFLFWRVWIGIWVFVISLLVAGFQGSTLVRHFTKFTKDIFAGLVALLFIFEAFNKLVKIFRAHPLEETLDYCTHVPNHCHIFRNITNTTVQAQCDAEIEVLKQETPQPNTALMSMILMFGTFFIAYFLRLFRNSQYLGRNARRAMADFGVPIAIVILVLVDWSANDTFTEKLTVPEGITVTNSTLRGWLIPPMGTADNPLPAWAIFAAAIPALLLYLLLFMETHICELIMMEKTKEKKGAGLHLDIVLLSLINLVSGIVGGPWICAATVRAVSHVSALTVMSTANVPGEAPKVIGIRDQRLTAFTVSLLLGVSVAMAPILKLVPFAVLFGVFLYMGVSGTNGVQFFDRVKICFMPVKHHPNVSYVQNVKTWRMVLFTVMQALGLALLWVVKSFSQIALAFPFFVVLMIPYRYLLKYIFTEKELNALDGAQAGSNMSGVRPDEEEKDFYQTAGECPIGPNTEAPLHRSVKGLLKMASSKEDK